MSIVLTAAGIFLAAIWSGVTILSLRAGSVVFFTEFFILLFSAAFLVYFIISIKIFKTDASRKAFIIIAFFSVLFRLILIPSAPVHENDVYRYMWDGRVSILGVNPYKYAPGDIDSLEGGGVRYRGEFIKERSFTDEEKTELGKLKVLRDRAPVLFENIGYRWVPTVYPPAAQAFFALSAFLKENSILMLKTVFLIFDLLSFFMIALILRSIGKNMSFSIVYGWSPLVLKEFANSAHYDAIPVFFMLLFLYFIITKRPGKGIASLAAAGASKLFPLFLAPVCAKVMRLKGLFLLAGFLVLAYAPFFIWGGTGVKGVFEGLSIYSSSWVFNGSIFVVLRSLMFFITGDEMTAVIGSKLLAGGIFLAFIVWVGPWDGRKAQDLLHKSFIILAAMFLLSPVADPWYYCWIIPFLCFFPYRSFMVLSWLLVLSYLSFSHGALLLRPGSSELPPLSILQYVPFFILLIWEINKKGKNVQRK